MRATVYVTIAEYAQIRQAADEHPFDPARFRAALVEVLGEDTVQRLEADVWPGVADLEMVPEVRERLHFQAEGAR